MHEYSLLYKAPLKGISPEIPLCLFVNTNKSIIPEQKGIFVKNPEEGLKISFKTFFGAFPIEQWYKFAGIDKLIIKIKAKGNFLVKVLHKNPYEPARNIYTSEFNNITSNDIFIEINLEELITKTGIIYPEIYPLDDTEIHEVSYLTEKKPSKEIKLGIIIPTYKREHYLIRNLRILKNLLQEKKNIFILIIDNANTFFDVFKQCACEELHKLLNKQIFIFTNPNYGGAGGFARGIIEASKLNLDFVILSDDDILYEPTTIERVEAFYKFADNQKPIIIGGGMFNLSNPQILNECGAIYKNLKVLSLKQNLNLCFEKDIEKYGENEFVRYFAWWFFASPLKVFEKVGLPLPLFIRGDDIEFGYRIKKYIPEAIFTNLLGVAVWHEEFYKKDNPITDYYITRNGLIFSALYENKMLKTYWNLLRYFGGAILTYRYERAKFIIKGIEDFIKGPHFLMKTNPDEYHKLLNKQLTQKLQDISSFFLKEKFNKPVKSSILKKLLIFMSFNGHLLPNWFIKSGKYPDDDGFILENLHSHRLSVIFRNETVVYCEPTQKKGYICRYSKYLFFRNLLNFFYVLVKFFIKFNKLKKEYKQEHKILTSENFWVNFLKKK